MIFHICSDTKKIYVFNIIKKNAGSVTKILSLTFIRTATPSSINNESPPAEISKTGWSFKPTNKPNAPIISNIAVSAPAFSSPKRLNSLFIFVDPKYPIP